MWQSEYLQLRRQVPVYAAVGADDAVFCHGDISERPRFAPLTRDSGGAARPRSSPVTFHPSTCPITRLHGALIPMRIVALELEVLVLNSEQILHRPVDAHRLGARAAVASCSAA